MLTCHSTDLRLRSILRFTLPTITALMAVPTIASIVPFGNAVAIDETFADARAIATADFDRDGDLDLLATSRGDNEIAWWENTAGDASAWTRHTIESGITVAELAGAAVGDFDGDAAVDVIAAVDATDTIILWQNQGDGSTWTRRTVGGGFSGPFAVAATDLDHDGDLDVVGTFEDGSRIAWFENVQGDATAWTPFQDLGFSSAGAVTLADLDHDGDLDAFAEGDSFAWWRNNGSGDAWVFVSLGSGVSGPAEAVGTGDLDGDGDRDLVGLTGGADDQVIWWENTDGQGTFALPVSLSAALGDPSSLAVFDLDADGDLDIAFTAETGGDVSWLENTAGDATAWTLRPVASAVAQPDQVRVADLDGDGDDDLLAAARGDGVLSWWPNETLHRSATFPIAHRVLGTGGFNQRPGVETADLDQDGRQDLLVTTFEGVRWWRNDGSPCAPDCTWPEHVITTDRFAVSVADMDADGDLDLLGHSGILPGIVWWENDGLPCGITCSWTLHTVTSDYLGVTDSRAVDLDGDGDMDVLAASKNAGTDSVSWWENDGTPCDPDCDWPEHSVVDEFNDTNSIVAADMDGDGDLDLLGNGRVAAVVAWWENDGSPCDPDCDWPRHVVETFFQLPQMLRAVDMDGDGDNDVLGASFGTDDEVTWWENDGSSCTPDCAWPRRRVDRDFYGAAALATADVDRDGDADIVGVANNADASINDIAWWENDRSACGFLCSWPKHTFDVTYPQAIDLSVADMDGDGDVDVLTSERDGDVAWWENRGGQFALPTADAAGQTTVAAASQDVVLLRIDGQHRGRGGDGDAELASLELRFEAPGGTALSDAEMAALLDALHLYRDDGDGAFEPGRDDGRPFISLVAPFTSSDGVLTWSMIDGDPNVQLTVDANVTWWLAADVALGAAAAPVLGLRVIHRTSASSTGEMAATDLPLVLEYEDDTTSATVVVNTPPQLVAPIGNQTVREGEPFALDIAPSFSDPNPGALTYTAVGLPSSLTISPAGSIHGQLATIDIAGSPYAVTVTATDPFGEEGNDTFQLSVLPDSQVILADGFESGDATGWSSAVP